MEKDQIVISEDRGIISVSGPDAGDFLQNILTNDVDKVVESNSIFSAIFTPQGKYLYEFFIIKSKDGYFLDCDNESTEEIIGYLSKYKLSSKIEIKNQSSSYVIGIISLEKFLEIQADEGRSAQTILYRESSVFIDPRVKELGARILSSLEKLHLTIKKLNLKIVDDKEYLKKAYACGVPIKGLKNLKDQLFGLEANFEKFKAIDFKKGCYIGQENTARMKLKNKLRRKLLPIKSESELKIGSDIMFNDIKIGKILINKPYPFALIKIFDPEISDFDNKELSVDNKKVYILK
jgi:folate-binding protein YgfZ